MPSMSESDRLRGLFTAQTKAKQLFTLIEDQHIIQPGLSEQQISDSIFELAKTQFHLTKHWHKRVVRAGENTIVAYRENPPDLIIQKNDIVFIDLGPVFEEWEADFGKTYVVGNHDAGAKILHDLGDIFRFGQLLYQCEKNIVAAEFFECIQQYIHHLGWENGTYHVGHIIGEFPHAHLSNAKEENVLHAGNLTRLDALDALGREKHWIFEIHIIDRALGVGGFFEDFLSMYRDV